MIRRRCRQQSRRCSPRGSTGSARTSVMSSNAHRSSARSSGTAPYGTFRHPRFRLAALCSTSFGRGYGSAAVSLLERSVALVPRANASDLLVDLGSALVDVGNFAKAREILDDAVTVARMASDRAGETRAVVERDWLRHQTAEDTD